MSIFPEKDCLSLKMTSVEHMHNEISVACFAGMYWEYKHSAHYHVKIGESEENMEGNRSREAHFPEIICYRICLLEIYFIYLFTTYIIQL